MSEDLNKDSFEHISDQSSNTTLYDSDKETEFCGRCELIVSIISTINNI